jgi:hypothetical protein
MAIMAGVLISATAPNVHDQLLSAAQIVAADLGYGRSLAVLNNDSYQFTFNAASDQYTLQYCGANPALATLPPSPFQSPTSSPTQYVVQLGSLPGASCPVAIYDVQQLTPAPIEATNVQFGPTGATAQAQPTVIWLSVGAGAAQRFISISIDPTTGLATVGAFQGTPPATGFASSGSGGTSGTSGTSGVGAQSQTTTN